MSEQAENSQKNTKNYPLAVRAEIKRMYVQGEGNMADICEKMKVSIWAARQWAASENWLGARAAYFKKKDEQMMPQPIAPLFEGPTIQMIQFQREVYLREHVQMYFEKLDDLETIMKALLKKVKSATEKDIARIAMAYCEVLLTKAKVMRIPITGYEIRQETQKSMPQIDEARMEAIEAKVAQPEQTEEIGEPTE